MTIDKSHLLDEIRRDPSALSHVKRTLTRKHAGALAVTLGLMGATGAIFAGALGAGVVLGVGGLLTGNFGMFVAGIGGSTALGAIAEGAAWVTDRVGDWASTYYLDSQRADRILRECASQDHGPAVPAPAARVGG